METTYVSNNQEVAKLWGLHLLEHYVVISNYVSKEYLLRENAQYTRHTTKKGQKQIFMVMFL